ncbi:hypothetical protein [Streptacidiphilus sp. EB103A]|uniref:hypothetical protein n=1 Tax=Streptacidiphilus sp. EB103A TaxID=3156275 RepID=UPI003515E156
MSSTPLTSPYAEQECPRNPGGGHMAKPVALDPGRFCVYCGAADPASLPTPQGTFTVFGIINRSGSRPELQVAGVIAGEAARVDLVDRPWAYTDTEGRWSGTFTAATWSDAEAMAHAGVESGALGEPWR